MPPNNEIKLEVCVDSIASAIAAADGGAARIELCSALSEGGLTPSVGVLKALKALPLSVPIFCMLRPRRGNDFVYTDLEMQAILHDMKALYEQGADGFVFGALTAEKDIDVDQCLLVLEGAKGRPMTFHRAFDVTNPLKMHETVATLAELGFQRILSSGFKQNAVDGVDALAQLIAKHHRDIIVMPGAGINTSNVEEIITTSKCLEFHGSAMTPPDAAQFTDNGATKMECDISMGKQDILPYDICDVNVVRKLVNIGKAMTAE